MIFLSRSLVVLSILTTAVVLPNAQAQETRPRQVQYAWWLTARFVPEDMAVAEVPIWQISTDWQSATALNMDLLPPEAASDPSSLAKESVDFVLDGDFNGDRIPDRAVVGVYRARTGEEGRFILILTRTASAWTKAYLREVPGTPGFLVLRVDSNGILSVSDCMECDGWRRLLWYGDHYDWEPYEEPGTPYSASC